MPGVLAIAGPTASGKSALAVALAKAVGGEVVNADALQVYGGLRVLTALPDTADMAGVPHHLFGHVDPRARHSVGAWSREALAVLADLRARGRTAILAGGTGLYFRALFEGLAEIPEPEPDALAQAKALSASALREAAERLDPVATARTRGDPQRLIRIVAVARGTAKPLSEWQADTRPRVADWAGVVVEPPRETLYARIEARFDAMVAGGGLEEAARFAALGLPDDLPASKAIGLAELVRAARGEIGLDTALGLAKRNSRRLAKRQTTWFRNQCGEWPRVGVGMDAREVLDALTGRSKHMFPTLRHSPVKPANDGGEKERR